MSANVIGQLNLKPMNKAYILIHFSFLVSYPMLQERLHIQILNVIIVFS